MLLLQENLIAVVPTVFLSHSTNALKKNILESVKFSLENSTELHYVFTERRIYGMVYITKLLQ